MKLKPLTGLTIAALLAVPAAFAEVSCSNENTAIVATTPASDFADHGNGTVTHTFTGLMWMRCSLGQSWDGDTCIGSATAHSWQAALQLAADINSGASNADNDGQPGFAGQTDWRLPSKNELESIVERRCWTPAVNAAIFPNTPPDFWFRSSSPYTDDSVNAWFVGSSYGYVHANAKVYSGHVRLVRAGR